MSYRTGFVGLALLGSIAASHAQGTVTFDYASQGAGIVWGVSSYEESSMSFKPDAGGFAVWLQGPGYANSPDNGTTCLQEGFGDSLSISSLAAHTFSLSSVDLAGLTLSSGATTINFFGFHSDGSIVSASFTTAGIAGNTAADFQTFLFASDWSDLTRVEVPGSGTPGQGWLMDNFVFSGGSSSGSIQPVPEPGVFALAGLGALALQIRRMKRAK